MEASQNQNVNIIFSENEPRRFTQFEKSGEQY